MSTSPLLSGASRGQRLSFGGSLCTVQYVGPVNGQGNKIWLGVEWDNDLRGKHNGTYNGKEYFKCLSPSPTAASFISLAGRQPDRQLSLLEGIRCKYVSEDPLQKTPVGNNAPIEISGKVVEEVGFDKIRGQLAKLDGLKNVILTGLCIGTSTKVGEEDIGTVCPMIELIDLSRNLIDNFDEIVNICKNLPRMRTLKLNENRFWDLAVPQHNDPPGVLGGLVHGITMSPDQTAHYQSALANIRELEMQHLLLPWDSLERTISYFISLRSFDGSRNHLRRITPSSTISSSLTTLILDHNDFTCLLDIVSLSRFPSMEVLRLKGNKIATLRGDSNCLGAFDSFPPSLRYVDLSSNLVTNWQFLDDLPRVFPGMRELRFSGNPIYGQASMNAGMNAAAEEGYMLSVARLADLTSLNFSKITAADRTNSEVFYLSLIANELAGVPADQEHTIIAKHSRYEDLCKQYGTPPVIRRDAGNMNANYLEARLIKFKFYLNETSQSHQTHAVTITEEIPKSLDIYRVKGIVGRRFGIQPLKVRLIWETGEWDPVGGYEDEGNAYADKHDHDSEAFSGQQGGRLVRREVELEDGTRQVGNWVDGSEATVRVEIIEYVSPSTKALGS